MKTHCLLDFFISLGRDLPGRIGVMYLAISASISGGVFIPNRNSRHMCCNRKVGFVFMFFCFFLFYDYMRGNQFRKVIHDKSGIDFL